jgi:hypothetical protein
VLLAIDIRGEMRGEEQRIAIIGMCGHYACRHINESLAATVVASAIGDVKDNGWEAVDVIRLATPCIGEYTCLSKRLEHGCRATRVRRNPWMVGEWYVPHLIVEFHASGYSHRLWHKVEEPIYRDKTIGITWQERLDAIVGVSQNSNIVVVSHLTMSL